MSLQEDAISAAESPPSGRKRVLTSKGYEYHLEQKLKRRDSARKKVALLTESLQLSLDEEFDRNLLRNEYSAWLQAYDNFLVAHQEYHQLLHEEERKEDEVTFQQWNVQFKALKETVEPWLPEHQAQGYGRVDDSEEVRADDSASHIATRGPPSDSGSRSSRISELSLVRIQAEQERAEIMARTSALKEKHELELAKRELEQRKFDLSLKEEELELKTRYAIADAKSRILGKYETQSMVSSNKVTQQQARNAPIGVKDAIEPLSISEKVEEKGLGDQTNTYKRALNPSAEEFVPPFHGTFQQATFSASEAALSMAKELKKPPADISKFDGNPMDFRRFKRQFHTRIVCYTDSDDERMTYLDQYTISDAHRIVVGYSHLENGAGYTTAMQELEARYGDPEVIAHAYIRKALEWPIIKSENAKALDDFGVFLMECQHAVQNIGVGHILEYSDNLKRLMGKLPVFLHDKWRNIVMKAKDSRRAINFSQFVELVRWEARKANDPTYGRSSIAQLQLSSMQKQNTTKPFRAKGLVTNVSTLDTENRRNTANKRCEVCHGEHPISECGKLRKEPHEKRIELLRLKGLCYGCLTYGHRSKDCRRRQTCRICSQLHPTILHRDSRGNIPEHKVPHPAEKEEITNLAATNTCCQYMGAGDRTRVAMSILPVKVKIRNINRVIETYALLDSGSTDTFCTESLMRALKVEGRKTKILLKTMGQTKVETTFAVEDLEVCSLDGGEVVELPPVLSQTTLPVSTCDIVYEEDLKQWKYLKELHLPRIESDIGLLIGSNVPKAMEPYKVIPSKGNGPYAICTKLGWVVNGPLGADNAHSESSDDVTVQVNRIEVAHPPTLHDQLVNHFNYDFSERMVDDVQEYSQEDRQFIDSVSRSIELKDGHYSIGLPFKDRNVQMPNNKGQAEQRLALLGKRLEKNSSLHQEYKTCMDHILQNGYARKVRQEDLTPKEGKAWYLPHHGVRHPRKHKLRVVFDCAARYGGTSLNDQLLSGPNLANSLMGTLLRFRQGNIAFLADVESMFHQVHVPLKDANFLRFLWWQEGDTTQPAIEYQMVVHLFGATSSPGCANFALLKAAEDNEELFDRKAANTMRRNFYVDDCLKSVDEEVEAVELYKDLRGMCANGGFNLTKWMSNSRYVMDAIPQPEWSSGAKNLDLDQEDLPIERVLGIQWCAESDKFEFRIDRKQNKDTRRGILSVVSSIYDPLGFLAPFVLRAKCLLQELCQLGLGWDDELPSNLKNEWYHWLAELETLSEFKVERCLKPSGFKEIQRTELHHFSDASQSGYGTVSYLRLISDNKIHCCLVMGKARVAPLKQVTIPRLELTAATVAVRTDRMLRRELELPISDSYFWTDSMAVLRYIQNEK